MYGTAYVQHSHQTIFDGLNRLFCTKGERERSSCCLNKTSYDKGVGFEQIHKVMKSLFFFFTSTAYHVYKIISFFLGKWLKKKRKCNFEAKKLQYIYIYPFDTKFNFHPQLPTEPNVRIKIIIISQTIKKCIYRLMSDQKRKREEQDSYI